MVNENTNLLGYALYVLFRRKVMLIVTFLVVFCSMIFFIWLIQPSFAAYSRVLVHNNYKQQLGLFNDLTSPGVYNPRVNWAINMVELAKSAELAEDMVAEFDLAERFRRKVEEPESGREIIKAGIVAAIEWPAVKMEEWGWVKRKPKDFFAEALDEFMEDMIEVELVEETEIVEIIIYGESPERANEMIDFLTEQLVTKVAGLDRFVANQAYQHATHEFESAESQYEAARSKLEQYKQQWRVTSFDDEKRLTLDSLQTTEKELDIARTELAGKKAEIKDINARMKKGDLAPKEYQEFVDDLSEIEQSIAGLDGRRVQMERNVEELRAHIDRIIKRENEYLRLEQQADLAEDLFLTLKKKANELLIQANTEIGEFSIRRVDNFKVSPVADPDWPDMIILIPLALFFAGGMALVLPFVVEFGLDYPRNPRELKQVAGTELLAVLPKHSLMRRFKA